jgi:hypothetical protein
MIEDSRACVTGSGRFAGDFPLQLPDFPHRASQQIPIANQNMNLAAIMSPESDARGRRVDSP